MAMLPNRTRRTDFVNGEHRVTLVGRMASHLCSLSNQNA